MGLLALGTPLNWPETKPLADHIRDHGITQFLHTWDRWSDRAGEPLLWGDEIEYLMISMKHPEPTTPTSMIDGEASSSSGNTTGTAHLSLRQTEVLSKLQAVTLDHKLEKYQPSCSPTIPTFHPEYGRYMLESTPGAPFTGNVKDLCRVEGDMRFRRQIIRSYLPVSELPVTLTVFPRLGVTDSAFTDPPTYPDPEKSSSRSLYVGEEITNPHARFPTLTANIRQRRGSKVDIRVPLFIDKNTEVPERYGKTLLSNGILNPAKPSEDTPDIRMDAMAFGMGNCCLQITFQAYNVAEATRVYDALVPIAPIMLALSAASPAFKGMLADVDARWNVIAASVDDRTEEERGLKPLENDTYRISKSRYDSVSCYISEDPRNKDEYADVLLPVNEKVRERISAHGLPSKLARHIGHLFIRDPLVQFAETIEQDDELSMDHFENIQSTNWQTIRFKPPPVNSPIGWRVEFRSMEVQITDFENAAFSVFIVLLTRAILSYDLNFYQPISQVDENMQTAQQRDGVRRGRFSFRRKVFPRGTAPTRSSQWASQPATRPPSPVLPTPPASRPTSSIGTEEAARCPSPDELEEEQGPEIDDMSIDEIINGKDESFPGLLGVVNLYLNSLNMDVATKCQLRKYLDLVKRRARGDLITPAAWIRDFIVKHPAYKHDSVVSEQINYDLIKAVDEMERGVRAAPELLGHDYVGSGPTGCL